jgi:glycosyltransferase involved in cell wall biosynthesis
MLQTVLDGVSETDHEVELVFFEAGPWPTELAAAGFRVEVIDTGRVRQPHRWVLAVLRLAKIFRARRPDLILNWAAKTHLYGAPAALLAGMGERTLWWQQNIPNGNWIDRCATLLPAQAVGCYSQAAARAQARMWPARSTFVVAAGTHPPASTPREAPLDLPADTTVIGLVGRLQSWKGQDRLLEAHALLRARGHRIHTVIVGGDAYGLSPQYAASLPVLASRLGLQSEVTMTDQVPDSGPYIEQMDILVNASDPEPFGIVLLEAMARGVAVVAVDSGGPAEFIEDGTTGVLAASGQPTDLADALERLLSSAALREEIGQAGGERFTREFTPEALRQRFFASLERLAPPHQEEREVTIVAHDVGSVGGMERQLAELALGLRALGYEVTVIARTCVLPADAGVRFHRVPGPRRPLLLAYPWFMIAGSIAVRRWRRGVVQTTGAIVLNRVDAIAVHCCHQVYSPNSSRTGALFRLYTGLVGRLTRVGERLCFRVNRPARVVCVSDGVAAEVREHYPALAGYVTTIHNGVDIEAFAPGARVTEAAELRERLGIDRQRLVLAFVGAANKGLATVLDAMRLAPEWDLLVAGRGHVQTLKELADSLGVSEAVHWLGVMRDIQVVYGAADAFVLPSDYETFSLVCFEAAASGLPVLATPVSGVRELIEDEYNGLLISASPEAIAERLARLAADPRLRARLGTAAREKASGFTSERMVAKHHELYSRLLAA